MPVFHAVAIFGRQCSDVIEADQGEKLHGHQAFEVLTSFVVGACIFNTRRGIRASSGASRKTTTPPVPSRAGVRPVQQGGQL